jgi:hypothetical protein
VITRRNKGSNNNNNSSFISTELEILEIAGINRFMCERFVALNEHVHIRHYLQTLCSHNFLFVHYLRLHNLRSILKTKDLIWDVLNYYRGNQT